MGVFNGVAGEGANSEDDEIGCRAKLAVIMLGLDCSLDDEPQWLLFEAEQQISYVKSV
jgi:hypothetical protein